MTLVSCEFSNPDLVWYENYLSKNSLNIYKNSTIPKIGIIDLGFTDEFNKEFEECINSFNDKCIFFASVGDRNLNSYFYPSKYEKVIPIGAVDEQGSIYDLSNLDTIDALWFPGVNLPISINGKVYKKSGSSYSTAIDTGYISSLFSKCVLNRTALFDFDCYDSSGMFDFQRLINQDY